MQEEGVITFQRVAPKSSIETWHIVVVVLFFVGLIYILVRRSRRQTEDNPGSLSLK